MEEVLNTMRATQSKKNALGKARAMELQLQSPQTMDSNLLEPTTDDIIHGKGGGDAGMRRIVGNGKRGRPRKMAGASNGVMEGGAMSNAKEMGAKIAEQLTSLHGKDFADQFHMGVMDKLKGGAEMRGGFWGALASLALPLIGNLFGSGQMTQKARDELMNLFDEKKGGMALLGRPGHGTYQGGAKKRGGAGPISAPPSGIEVSHAMMSPAQSGLAGQALGGQDVPPGGLAPVAYGSPPQAPASFKRNAVGMGRPAGAGMKACGGAVTQKGREDERLGMEVKGLKDKVAMVVARKKAPVGGAVSQMGREDDKLGMEVAILKKKMKGGVGTGAGESCNSCMSCKGSGPAGAGKKKSSARGQMISKIMKSKGMTLGQASKYLKENPQG
jgi:hypothetical protein